MCVCASACMDRSFLLVLLELVLLRALSRGLEKKNNSRAQTDDQCETSLSMCVGWVGMTEVGLGREKERERGKSVSLPLSLPIYIYTHVCMYNTRAGWVTD